MKRMDKMNSHLAPFSSGASLGGTVSHYRDKEKIYAQGAPAYTLFYIQEGGCGSPPERNISHQQLPRFWVRMIFLASFASQAILFVCPRPSR